MDPFLPRYNDKQRVLIYKRLYGNSPSYMNDLLKRNADVYQRSSRYGTLNLVCPRFVRETEGGRSFTEVYLIS